MINESNSQSGAVRIPPHSLEAEKSVIGSIMLDSEAMHEVADILGEEDFYHDKNRIIYKTIFDLFERHDPIDFLFVSNRLKDQKVLDEVGGNGYLTELVNSVPSASNAKYYAEIVHRKRILRDLISASHHISGLGYDESEDIDILLDQAEKKIFDISQSSNNKDIVSIKDALDDAWERIDKLHKSKDEIRGVPTGFRDLDNLLAGLQKSDLIILAARPSHGKTSLALDIARGVAIKHNVPVGIFSLEMSVGQLADRLLASEAHVDSWKLRTGKITGEDEFLRIRDAMDRLAKAPIFIDDDASNNIIKMRSSARRIQSQHGLGLIIVDYLQLMSPRKHTESMVQQITEISRSLKQLARELDVPVLALSQLSRSVEQRGGVPRLSDLRDSGSIEQDADVVMFIYREDKYRETEKKNIAQIMVEKHRNGPTGNVELYFNEQKVSFSTIEKGDFGNI